MGRPLQLTAWSTAKSSVTGRRTGGPSEADRGPFAGGRSGSKARFSTGQPRPSVSNIISSPKQSLQFQACMDSIATWNLRDIENPTGQELCILHNLASLMIPSQPMATPSTILHPDFFPIHPSNSLTTARCPTIQLSSHTVYPAHRIQAARLRTGCLQRMLKNTKQQPDRRDTWSRV